MSTAKSKKTPKKLGRAATIERAAAIMGYPEEVIKAAKSAGLDGFDDHNRIDCDALKAALSSDENKAVLEIADSAITKEQAEIRRILLQCRKLDFQNEVMFGQYELRTHIDAWQTDKAESLKRLLNTKIINELLPRLQGLMVPEMIAATRPYITAIVEDFKKPLPKG